MFEAQKFPSLKEINYFLRLEIVSKDPAFEGLLDSRIKHLRIMIENYYNQLYQRQ